MANPRPAALAKSARTATTVRAFYNVSTATLLPSVKPQLQKDLGVGNASGGRGVLYGNDNTVPQVALDAALSSGTAYRCLERRAAFLTGRGLPPEVAELPVPGHLNKTYDELWSEECSDWGWFNGVAFLVRWSYESVSTGKPGEVHLLPFPSVRKTDKGTYFLNHKFGRKGFKANETTEHFPFDNTPASIQAVLDKAEQPIDPDNPEGPKHGQPGQILYAYIAKAGEKDYPLPPHWAGLEDVLLDTELSKFDLEEVRNGFFPNGVLALIGEEDDQTEDENGMTQAERTNEALRDFTGNGTNPTGRDKLLVLEAKTKEQAPILTPFNGTTNMEKLDAKKEATGQVVCRHIGIPPILAGFAKAGQLGAAQEILNAVELTQDDLAPAQRKALRTLALLLPELKSVQVLPKKPVSFLPPEVLAVLTTDELRALGDYKPLPAPTPAA